MSMGMKLQPEAADAVEACNFRKTGIRGIVLELDNPDDPTEIVQRKDLVLNHEGENSNLKDFLDKVKAGGPCYALFYATFQTDGGEAKTVGYAVNWCQDPVPMKQRMMYASGYQILNAQRACKGFREKIEASIPYDMTYANLYYSLPNSIRMGLLGNAKSMEGVPATKNEQGVVEFVEPK